jgi:8-oxo-dGTP pyrophosphatase MutT (NUDIX family)
MTWKPNVTVAAVVERDGQFLFVEEHIDGQLLLNQPAGHLEPGESLLEAVKRETREETAWDFEPQALLGVYRWRTPDRATTYLRFAFSGAVRNRHSDQPLDATIQRVIWIRPEEIGNHRLRSPLVMRCVDDYQRGCRYPLSLLVELNDEN